MSRRELTFEGACEIIGREKLVLFETMETGRILCTAVGIRLDEHNNYHYFGAEDKYWLEDGLLNIKRGAFTYSMALYQHMELP